MSVEKRYFVGHPDSSLLLDYYIWRSDRSAHAYGVRDAEDGEIVVHAHIDGFSVDDDGRKGLVVLENDVIEIPEEIFVWGRYDHDELELENVPLDLIDIFESNIDDYFKHYPYPDEYDIYNVKRGMVLKYYLGKEVWSWM